MHPCCLCAPNAREPYQALAGPLTIDALQRESWDCAEAQGHHAALAPRQVTDPRYLMLADLSYVYVAVTDLAQKIKRDGVPAGSLTADIFQEYIGNAIQLVLNRHQGISTPLPPIRDIPTAARLTLIHTEVSEAFDASEQRNASLMAELADIVIRVADLAETVGGNLDTAVQAKLAYNRTRPYLFGTPEVTPYA